MKRKMGIDYGSVRIGIAISDPLGITARGIETINWNGTDMEWAIQRIVTLIKEHSVDTVVVGLPRRTDGKTSQSEENARLMSKRIEDEFIIKSTNNTENEGHKENTSTSAIKKSNDQENNDPPLMICNIPSDETNKEIIPKSDVSQNDLTQNKSSIKVILKDERYTTVLANRIMRETKIKQSKKKSIVDQIAAEIILQDYLDHCHF